MIKLLGMLNSLYAKRDTRTKQLHAMEHYGMWISGKHMAMRKDLINEIDRIDKKIHGIYEKGLLNYGEEFENILLDIVTSSNWQVKK